MKKILVKFINAYWLKEYVLLLRNFRPSSFRKRAMLISVIDHKRNCQGLADRFKGIVSVYALSKAVGMEFRCIYTHPFSLTDYLIPNQYDWTPNKDEISHSLKNVRFRILRKELTMKRLLRVLPTKKQWNIYANMDYLDEINAIYGQNFQWGNLFNELFKPTKELQEQIDFHSNQIGTPHFMACVFRFQSLLGDFEEYHYKALSTEMQEKLIEKNRKALVKFIQSVNCPVLVTSDSMLFISRIKDLDNVYTLPGKVVHLDCVIGEKKEVYMKSFIDFFMLSKATKVYSIGTKEMYPTNFPLYASKINNAPFERILIE